MTTLFKTLIFILLSLALTACSQTNALNKLSLTAEYKTIVHDNVMKAAHQKHIADNGGQDGHYSINNRLKNLTKKIIKANGLTDKNIEVILLKSTSVNAYSLSSKSHLAYVYVTRGLVEFIANDDQLAAVLAHEIAHIALGHHLKRQASSGNQFNQSQELEADQHSIKLLKKSNFKLAETIKLLERLDIFQAEQKFLNQADYPTNKKRIENLSDVIAGI
ncbi:MAG: M48 family metallopeptidase [Alphaproteobacteria bacterium]|nr:M48 family metallopeptidase [Alphaproteobacteria bacterium]